MPPVVIIVQFPQQGHKSPSLTQQVYSNSLPDGITLSWFKDPSQSIALNLRSHVRETCQSKSQLRIHSGPVSDRYEVSLYELIGTLRSDDGDANGNARKAIVLISKTTILHVHHAFLYISLPSLHDYDVKMPNFTMYRGSTQATEATTKFPLPS